ncbi:MAG TPA: response regulator [Archangium sp.]|nr:response regulator [Archangium sp.]
MKRILLVDDDLDLIEIYTELLEQLGFSITSALDGQKALALAPRLQPDLIITDVSMPRMDGLELCRRLRADERIHDIPLIIHSSEVELRVPPGEVFLPKPCELSALVTLVDQLLADAQDDPVRLAPQADTSRSHRSISSAASTSAPSLRAREPSALACSARCG